jgi:hypothetical protein
VTHLHQRSIIVGGCYGTMGSWPRFSHRDIEHEHHVATQWGRGYGYDRMVLRQTNAKFLGVPSHVQVDHGPKGF